MSAIGEWFRRLSYLSNRARHEESLRREMLAHREMMGEPSRFGNTLRLREESRDVWGWGWLDNVVRDVRFASRTLWRTPGFSLTAIVSLALATGATTAIFSIVNSVLLRPLPIRDADRLVQVREIHQTGGAGFVAWGDMQEFRAQSVSFERFAGYELTTRLLETRDGSERVMAVITDRDFFPLLEVAPLLGRTYTVDDPASAMSWSAPGCGGDSSTVIHR